AGDMALLHVEIGRAVLDEHVELLERAAVHQEFDALARGELAALVLGLDAGVAAALPRADAAFLKLVENVLHDPLLAPQQTAAPAAIAGRTGVTAVIARAGPSVIFPCCLPHEEEGHKRPIVRQNTGVTPFLLPARREQSGEPSYR